MRLFVRLGAALALALVIAGSAPPAAHAAPGAEKPASGSKDKSKNKSKIAKKAQKQESPQEKEPRPKGPLSKGAPNAGRLYGGVKLGSSKSLEVRKGASTWGLPLLTRVLRRSASAIARKHKGSVLFVGDLSGKHGGPLLGHNSHQSGRDADVGFYMVNEKGRHVNPHRFVAFAGNGRPRGTEIVRFDDERNWALVEALIKDEKSPVRYMFVSSALRARLLAYAAKKNVSKELYTKAAATLMSPKDADVHDDHFHVRIACPAAMLPACVEESNLPTPAPKTEAAGVAAKSDDKPAAP